MEFVCEMCNCMYKSKDNLIRHVKSVHEKVKFACEKCGLNFTRRNYLNVHLKTEAGLRQCIRGQKKIKGVVTPYSVGSTVTTAASKPSTTTTSTSTSTTIPSTSGMQPTMRFCAGCRKEVVENHWSYHLRTNEHKRNTGVSYYNGPFKSIKSVFKERIETLMLENMDEGQLNAETFFKEAEPPVLEMLEEMLRKHISIKFNVEIFCEYLKIMDEDEVVVEMKSHQAKMMPLLSTTDIESIYTQMVTEILTKMSEFQERDSGWTLIRILHVELNINQYTPIRGSSYIPLPTFLVKKKACINVENSDIFCFKWAIISAMMPQSINSNRCASYKVQNIYDDLIPVQNSSIILNFTGLTFPLSLNDVKKFEALNPWISISVFGYDEEIKKIVGPHHITKEEKCNHINLLLLQNEDRFHYVWIKNLSR